MTDDDTNADELRRTEQHETVDSPEEWADVPVDPDARALGYEIEQWERIPTSKDEQVIFLPGNDEDLKDAAFVVLDESDLCDLVTRR